ncbi:MAG: peptidoglycan recognition family protein [Planctomycetota bacterium]|nr:peptidoglycan recognition family protein [Planctomycetota bacterium]
MNENTHNRVDRREVLRGGALLGLAGLLTGPLVGCGGRAAGLPAPQWPGAKPVRPTPTVTSASPLPPARPMPATTGAGYYALPSGVIPRSQWTSQGVIMSRLTANGQDGRMGRIERITIHHDAMESTGIRSQGDAARRMALVRNGHVNRRPEPFADIGYHFVIDPQGRVWEARPLAYQGAHVKGQNEHNLGIMVMGNFDRHRPTSSQVQTLESFVCAMMRKYQVPVGRVKTHQEMASTECPGRNLQRQLIASRGRGGTIARA